MGLLLKEGAFGSSPDLRKHIGGGFGCRGSFAAGSCTGSAFQLWFEPREPRGPAAGGRRCSRALTPNTSLAFCATCTPQRCRCSLPAHTLTHQLLQCSSEQRCCIRHLNRCPNQSPGFACRHVDGGHGGGRQAARERL
jgi:hypothetical protein